MGGGKVAGIAVGIVAIVVIVFIFMQDEESSVFQAASDIVTNEEEPETSSLEQETKIDTVTETVPVHTRVHLLSDTYRVESGSDKTLTYTTGPASAAYIVGNATVSGGGSVQLLVRNEDGICPGLICDQTVVRSSENVMSWKVDENRTVNLKVFTGSKQQLVFTTISSAPQTITFDFDILYEEMVTRPATSATNEENSTKSETYTIPSLE